MRNLYLALLLLVPFTTTYAFMLTTVEPSAQYEPIVLQEGQLQTDVFLGTLTGDPETFEFTTTAEETNLTLGITQRNKEPVPFTLLVVEKLKTGGVFEITRSSNDLASWHSAWDGLLAMSALHSQPLTLTLSPGTYLIEISTPENQGAYAVQFVDLPNEHYFEALSTVWQLQRHFDVGWHRYLLSSHVGIPFLIILIILTSYRSYRGKRLAEYGT